jgi:hypothetical protein
MKRKTGQIVRVGSGGDAFSAFVPAPLPPEPPLKLTEKDQGLIERANRALAQLDGMTLLLPDTSLFVYAHFIRELPALREARRCQRQVEMSGSQPSRNVGLDSVFSGNSMGKKIAVVVRSRS